MSSNTQKIKVSDEELNSIHSLQVKFQEKIEQFGKLYLDKMSVDAAIKAITEKEVQLQTEWESLKKQETTLVDTILKKYGEGSLDIKEGVFIPDVKPANIS